MSCKKEIQVKKDMEYKYGFKLTTDEYLVLRVLSRRERRKLLLGRMKANGQQNTNPPDYLFTKGARRGR
jgi:hypothetical protein